ncbi:MAG: hypothetical protein WC839_01215 [Candidatus Paceibacterota bacterium]
MEFKKTDLIILSEKKLHVSSSAIILFEKITKFHREKSNGLWIKIRDVKNQSNRLNLPIFTPSEEVLYICDQEATDLLILKDTVSNFNFFDNYHYEKSINAGSILFNKNETRFQSTVSGLLRKEDNIFLAMCLIPTVLNIEIDFVVNHIQKRDKDALPECFFKENHYLNKILKVFKI